VEEQVPKDGLEGLKDRNRKPHNTQPGKVTNDRRANTEFTHNRDLDANRIRFRLKT
jgi:hypothetical protein